MIAVLNQKGGCGKTTIALNLAACLVDTGDAVAVLDADPQQSATKWAKGGELPFQVLPIDLTQGARKVKNFIEAKTKNADVIVIDCPPELREPAMLAALLANLVLIPVMPSPLDLWAAESAVSLVRDARELNKGDHPKIVLLQSRLLSNTIISRELAGTLRDIGEDVAPMGICQRVSLAECVLAGSTINTYAPQSAAHEDFISLCTFIKNTLSAQKDMCA